MAEILYQRLEFGQRTGAEDSVHLERFPEADDTLVDSSLEEAMAGIREVVTLGRSLREQHRLLAPHRAEAIQDLVPAVLRVQSCSGQKT